MHPTRDTLVESYKAGTFLQTVYARSLAERDERDALAEELVGLHNEGAIDLVAGFASLQNSPDTGVDFFLTRHVFEKVLPEINAPLPSVMACVHHLHAEAGRDMAAGMIFDAYISFCAKAPSRPEEALAEIKGNPSLMNLLTPTIIAGARIDIARYTTEAVRLAGDENIEIRRHAVFALARIEWKEGLLPPESAYAALERAVAKEDDDELLGCAIRASFSLLKHDSGQEDRVVVLVESALSRGGDYAIHAASELFGFHTKELPERVMNALVPHLLRVKSDNKGTIDNIDYGLSLLLKTGNPRKAVEILEELLIAHRDALSIDVFDSVVSDIRKDEALMATVATKWLLRGEPVLCEGVYAVAGAGHGADIPLQIDPSALQPLDGIHIIFVARKAIGYLFFTPISAASVIVSLMRHTSEKQVLAELGRHLLDPLLLNYPGKVRAYVAQCAEKEAPGKVQEQLKAVLKALEGYLDGLRSMGNIPELHPSEAHREAHKRRFARQIAESFKRAQEKSVFLNLFPRLVLLYGRRSINYVYGPDEQATRTEIPLKNHSVEMEFPRAEQLDPFGLEYTLRICRAEQFHT